MTFLERVPIYPRLISMWIISLLNSVLFKKRQLFEFVILQPFLAILSPTTLIPFTKLRFRWSFWDAYLTILNLNWINGYDKKPKFFSYQFFFFNFVKKWKLMIIRWPFYNHFWSFFCQLQKNLSQNWGSDSFLRCLVCLSGLKKT